MSQETQDCVKTFTAGGARAQHRLVVLSSGVLAYADAYTPAIGRIEKATFASADTAGVRLLPGEGTFKLVASAAITTGAYVYQAANGKIDDVGFIPVGIALEAASADGDIIEVLPSRNIPANVASVAATGSAQGDAAALTAGINTVSAADGTKGVILPGANAGLVVEVYNQHATNGLKVYPATGDDINDGTPDAAITMEGKGIARFTGLDTTTWAASYVVNT
ncbi:MAG: hypothetical protein E6R03_15285 [Hyphomicrobiaceae bacterium]|nr:MAG: hypothetical protein E6R03_15285 [Hyphomicrobiaceae bacterium]